MIGPGVEFLGEVDDPTKVSIAALRSIKKLVDGTPTELLAQLSQSRGLGNFGVALEGCRCGKKLHDELGAEGQGLGDGLRALEKEHSSFGAGGSVRKFRDGTHARRTGII